MQKVNKKTIIPLDGDMSRINDIFKKECERAAKIGTPNKQRILEIIQSFYLLDCSTASKYELDLFLGINYPCKSMGVISLECKKLDIINSQIFYEAVSKADHYEVLPKTNGKVCFDLTFHNMMLD